MMLSNNQQVFFELLKAGLWEEDVRLSQYINIDFTAVMQLAGEQAVVGLIVAGLERVIDVKVPQAEKIQFVGQVMLLEQRNKAMNAFVVKLIDLLWEQDVYALLVKGQGIAQCYEKPLWRTCGDVDLLLSESNYEKAKNVLLPIATDVEKEYTKFKHLGMTIDGWNVELHGTLHSRLSGHVDSLTDSMQRAAIFHGNVRSWENGKCTVFLPAPDEDVIFVFTHILHHFYLEGIGLRQICDWCRLLWTYHAEINVKLLEQRLCEAGLMSEWQAFAAFTVDWLGMPIEAMPLYSSDEKWSKKAVKILNFVLEVGNFGHNRQSAKGKMSSAWKKTLDFAHHSLIFPLDSVKFFWHFLWDGIGLALFMK